MAVEPKPFQAAEPRGDPSLKPAAPDPAPDATAVPANAAFEDYPLTRQEYISAMVHFYRGEMHRSQIWRARLDTTTNWAVVTVAAVISFTFGDANHPHVVLLLSNLIVTVFLFHEARRFRYFDVYRARVRMLEENFYLPMLTRQLVSPDREWGKCVAEDLDHPSFKTSLFEAIGFRLSRNFVWMYLILMIAWLMKLFVHPTQATSVAEIFARMAVGPIPPWMILLAFLVFAGGIAAALVGAARYGFSEDEIKGLERDRQRWKV
jgi:uncharacterized membrane protein